MIYKRYSILYLIGVAFLLGSCAPFDYVGDTKDWLMHGHGTQTWTSSRYGSQVGDEYTGEFVKGWRTGYGTMTWAKGDEYTGWWKNDRWHGKGTFTWLSGSKYTGEFPRSGTTQGTYTWGTGKVKGNEYTGEWVNEQRHGQGTYTLKDGKKFVGEWKDHLPYNGQGTFWMVGSGIEDPTVTGLWRGGVFFTPKEWAVTQEKKAAKAAKQAKANKEIIKSIRRLAERGDVNAQYNLGKIYHEGLLGVSWDHREAVKWLIKAALQGDNRARNRLVDIAPAAVDEVIRIQTMNIAKAQCTELGLTKGTDKHADCAVRMFSTARADQRIKQQVKENRAETDRLIQESKTESYRRTLEQARLQRAALEAQKRQRDRDTGLRMMNLGAEMMQGNTGSKSNKIRCTSQSFGADLSQID